MWALITIRYALLVLGLRTELYAMAAEDTVHAKLLLPVLEDQTHIPASDNLGEPFDFMHSNLIT